MGKADDGSLRRRPDVNGDNKPKRPRRTSKDEPVRGADSRRETDLLNWLDDIGDLGRAHAMNAGEPQRNPDRDLLPDF